MVRAAVLRIAMAFALIVQIYAPIASNATIAAALSDPLANAIICSHDTSPGAQDPQSGPAGQKHSHLCDFCWLATANGASTDSAQILQPLPALLPAFVSIASQDATPRPRLLDHIRARAPPTFA